MKISESERRQSAPLLVLHYYMSTTCHNATQYEVSINGSIKIVYVLEFDLLLKQIFPIYIPDTKLNSSLE